MNTSAEQLYLTGTSFARAIPLLLIALAAFVGNGLILVSVVRTKSLRRTPGNAFVVNLALSDILAALLVMSIALTTVMYQGHWVFSESFCQAEALLVVLFSNVTFLTLVFFSIYRYLLITSKLGYTQAYLWKRVQLSLLTIWIFASVFSLPPLVGWGKFAYLRHYQMCTLDWRIDKSYGIVLMFFVFFIPQCLMIHSYCGIFKFIKAHNQRLFKGFSLHPRKVLPEHPRQIKVMESKPVNINLNPAPCPTDLESSYSQSSLDRHVDDQLPDDVNWKERGKDKFGKDNDCSGLKNIGSRTTTNQRAQLNQDDLKPKENNNKKFEKVSKCQSGINKCSSPAADLPTNLNKLHKLGKLKRNNSKNTRKIYRETKLVRVLLVTVVTFYVCWLPFATDSLLQVLGLSTERPPYFQVISFWMASANAVCNPIIYVLLNSQLRSACFETLRSIKLLFLCSKPD